MQTSRLLSKRLLSLCRKGILRTQMKGLIPGGTCLVQTSHIDANGCLHCTTNLLESDLQHNPTLLQEEPVEIKFIDRASNIYLFVIGKLHIVRSSLKGKSMTKENESIELKIQVTSGSAYCMNKSGDSINILQPLN